MSSAPDAIEVFYSYSHKDEELRDQLETHLKILQRQGVITGWHDRRIIAGSELEQEISQHLDRAQVILLLISADFIASDYCWDKEMERAIQRHAAREARVIPVILRDCDWKGAPFGRLLAMPKDGLPITSWNNRDEAFADVARGIRRAVEELVVPHEFLGTVTIETVPANGPTLSAWVPGIQKPIAETTTSEGKYRLVVPRQFVKSLSFKLDGLAYEVEQTILQENEGHTQMNLKLKLPDMRKNAMDAIRQIRG